MIATAAVLQNVPLLDGLPDELLESLARELTEVSVPAGEWIMREGERANSMFLVRRGRQ